MPSSTSTTPRARCRSCIKASRPRWTDATAGARPIWRSGLAVLEEQGIGTNAIYYVGHGAVRRRVLGNARTERRWTDELEAMKALVQKGHGGRGLRVLDRDSSTLPGYLRRRPKRSSSSLKSSAPYDGIYDTHDRDLGASYRGRWLPRHPSTRRSASARSQGTRIIFSHFNAQGAHNYGRADEGAARRSRPHGREVWTSAAAQHVYTATQSSLRAYAIPRWASAGGHETMVARFDDPESGQPSSTFKRWRCLAIRGGASKLLFADPRDLSSTAARSRTSPRRWAAPRARKPCESILSEGQRRGHEPRPLRHREHAPIWRPRSG